MTTPEKMLILLNKNDNITLNEIHKKWKGNNTINTTKILQYISLASKIKISGKKEVIYFNSPFVLKENPDINGTIGITYNSKGWKLAFSSDYKLEKQLHSFLKKNRNYKLKEYE